MSERDSSARKTVTVSDEDLGSYCTRTTTLSATPRASITVSAGKARPVRA